MVISGLLGEKAAMFRGINSINLDAKSRIALPTRYRQSIQNNAENRIVLTIDTEQPCLLMYPMPAWQVIEQKLADLPSFHPVTRRIQRLLMGHATEIEIDSHSRILIPALLRDYAKIDKRIMLVGQGNKFELWDETTWQRSRDQWITEGLSKENGELPKELETLSL